MPLANITDSLTGEVHQVQLPSGVSKAVYQGAQDNGLSLSDGQLRQMTKSYRESQNNLKEAFENNAGSTVGLKGEAYKSRAGARDAFLDQYGSGDNFVADYMANGEGYTLGDAEGLIEEINEAQGTDSIEEAVNNSMEHNASNDYKVMIEIMASTGLGTREAREQLESMNDVEYSALVNK